MVDVLPAQSCLLSSNKEQQVCRTCLTEVSKDYFWLESFYMEKKVIDIYKNVISQEINTDDFFPKKICSACYNDLIKFYTFKSKVQDSETVLKNRWLQVQEDEKKIQEEDNRNIQSQFSPENVGGDCDSFYDVSEKDDNEESEDEVPLMKRFKRESNKHINDNRTENNKNLNLNNIKKQIESSDIHNIEIKHDKADKNSNKIKPKAKRKKCLTEGEECTEAGLAGKSKPQKRKREACKECGKVLLAYLMKNHLRTHTREKPFGCDKCQACFAEKSNLSRHMKLHGNIRPHKCSICDKGFLRPSTLTIHEATAHTTEANFTCSLCGKGFKHQSFLNKHLRNIRIQTGQPKCVGPRYTCSVCGDLFDTQATLTAHKMKHEVPKGFLCTICGNGYSSKAVLDSHQRVHTGEKKYSCNMCERKFTFRSTLRTHILLHKGEKPLSCHICNKKFRQYSHLNTHIKGQHSNERPYQCQYCGKTFKQNGNLRVHTRIHTGETPYHCDICEKAFHDSSSLKKHRKGHVLNSEKSST